MLFSRHKKLLKDRDAGLVFCWRGGFGGNRGGMLIALTIALGMFAFTFWGMSLSFEGDRPETRKYAKIMLMEEPSPEMALWVDRHSPFPSRWDPQSDAQHQERVETALEKVFRTMSAPAVPWREMPKVKKSLSTPRLSTKGAVEMGGLPERIEKGGESGVLELIVTLEPSANLRSRFTDSKIPLNVIVPAQAYGSSLQFIVSVNQEGEVVYCSPVAWQSTEYGKSVENWVRLQKFTPANQVVVGEVTVQVEVEKHVRN